MVDPSAQWPCTIISARYGGIYEGAPWLAFPLRFVSIPAEVIGGDTDCDVWFHSPEADFVGRGASPNEAMADMVLRAERYKDRIQKSAWRYL